MRLLPLFIASHLALLILTLPAAMGQQLLQGTIVEMGKDAARGVPGIEVSVPGIDEDITNASGSFKLYLPNDWKSASITLKNSPMKIIRPALGEVKLPAQNAIEVVVCGAEKKRLLAKVSALEADIKRLRKERVLSQQQVSTIQHQMLDTILHYEQVLQAKEESLIESDTEKHAKSEQIAALEKQILELEERLEGALEEKYRQQKKLFDQITASLKNYVDQTKNLRDMLLPERLEPYFLNPGARQRLYDSIEKYNAARNTILESKDGWVMGVSHFWDEEELPSLAEETLVYLLEEVHDKAMYPMEFSVNGPLKDALSQKTTSRRAQKLAVEGAENGLPTLNDRVEQLEEKVRNLTQRLTEQI